MAQTKQANAARSKNRHTAPRDLKSQLSQLAALNIDGLREAWQETFSREAPPIRSPDVLLRLLAWELQARSSGGLDTKTTSQIRRIAEAIERDGTYELPVRRDLSPGVVLTREWKGTLYKVTVTDNGFRYGDQTFRSLSDIACTITGTKWSGPRFFGLEQPGKKKKRSPR